MVVEEEVGSPAVGFFGDVSAVDIGTECGVEVEPGILVGNEGSSFLAFDFCLESIGLSLEPFDDLGVDMFKAFGVAGVPDERGIELRLGHTVFGQDLTVVFGQGIIVSEVHSRLLEDTVRAV